MNENFTLLIEISEINLEVRLDVNITAEHRQRRHTSRCNHVSFIAMKNTKRLPG